MLRASGSIFLLTGAPSCFCGGGLAPVIDKLIAARRVTDRRELAVWKPTSHAFPATSLTYLGNVMNGAARSFYREHGLSSIAPAYEAQAVLDAVLMFCKHCLRFSMGWCPTYQKGHSPYREPYYLVGRTASVSACLLIARIAR